MLGLSVWRNKMHHSGCDGPQLLDRLSRTIEPPHKRVARCKNAIWGGMGWVMIDALLHREHTSYREIGHRSVAFVLERAGIPYTFDEVRDLVAQIERLRPFREVPEALARLQTRYRLVVLSNGDPDMLETARRYHGIPFDRVISVAVANAFKPHVATYKKAAEIVGVRMDQVLFIANHAFDCIGAKSAGMRTAFIDRRRRPFGMTPHQPDLIVPTMQDLADALV